MPNDHSVRSIDKLMVACNMVSVSMCVSYHQRVIYPDQFFNSFSQRYRAADASVYQNGSLCAAK